MLNLKTLEDVNNYYIRKGIEPYWRTYEHSGWLKLEHIKIVTERFDYLLKLYPDLKINGIGDSYSFSFDYYKRWGKKLQLKEPTYKFDPFGYRHEKDENNRDINAYFKVNFNAILIVHNSRLLRENTNLSEQLSNTLTHEFAHALDNQYKISTNTLFIDFYNGFKDNAFVLWSNMKPQEIDEGIATIFEKSFYNDSIVITKGRDLIDKIIKESQIKSTN